VSSPSRRLADPLLRLLGADPDVFHPLYRTQKLQLRRGSRLVPTKSGRSPSSSTFLTVCLIAGLYGMTSCLYMALAKAATLGAVLALTTGCVFLLLVIVTDHFDVLVNPREWLVLAAHPHDDRSFVLAKLVAIGRTLSILWALLFVPPSVAVALSRDSPAAGLAFLAGAAGAGLATATAGMLVAALLLKTGGRRALDRLMPWLQGLFQVGYLLVIGGQSFLDLMEARRTSDLGWVPWGVPVFWFAAPLELVLEGTSTPALGRLALAVATLCLLLGGATRWLGSGLGERLLEPLPSRPVAPGRQITGSRRAAGNERARLFALLRVHLRSDWRVRSEFLVIPILGVYMLLFRHVDPGPGGQDGMSTFFFGWFLMLSADVLTRTSRPASLWWILTSPIDRARFSMASLTLVRTFQLAPLFIAVVLAGLRTGAPWPDQLARAIELLAMGDLLLLLGKGLFPEFPFSRPRAQSTGSGRTALSLVGALLSSLLTGAVLLFALLGPLGAWAGAATFALLRIPAGLWARRRTAAAAEGLELAATA
jgi:hypothetical protein